MLAFGCTRKAELTFADMKGDWWAQVYYNDDSTDYNYEEVLITDSVFVSYSWHNWFSKSMEGYKYNAHEIYREEDSDDYVNYEIFNRDSFRIYRKTDSISFSMKFNRIKNSNLVISDSTWLDNENDGPDKFVVASALRGVKYLQDGVIKGDSIISSDCKAKFVDNEWFFTFDNDRDIDKCRYKFKAYKKDGITWFEKHRVPDEFYSLKDDNQLPPIALRPGEEPIPRCTITEWELVYKEKMPEI